MVTDGELSGGVRNVQEPIAAGSGSVTEEVRTISQTTLITHLSPISPPLTLGRTPNYFDHLDQEELTVGATPPTTNCVQMEGLKVRVQ